MLRINKERNQEDIFLFQHAFTAAICVFIAVIFDSYHSFSQECWLVLSAFIVCQSSIGTPIRQGIISITCILGALIVIWLLQKYILNQSLFYWMVVIIYISLVSLLFSNRAIIQGRFFLIVFSLAILIAGFSPTPTIAFTHRIADVLIGACIGIVCCQIVFPVKLDQALSRGLLPLLKELKIYTDLITKNFLQQLNHTDELAAKRLQLRQVLEFQEGVFPEWVYDKGFNPALRSGFRFFLIKLEQITEICFSMDYFSSKKIANEYLAEISTFIESSMQKNQELIQILIDYFQHERLKGITSDFTSDIVALENALHHIVPSINFLDMSQDYIILTNFIRDIKDMRILLIELVNALPAKI